MERSGIIGVYNEVIFVSINEPSYVKPLVARNRSR